MGHTNRAGNDAVTVKPTDQHAIPTESEPRGRLAAELRRLRDLAGISGRDLAGRVGISQSTLSRIETGNAVPSLPQVLAWSREVGASPDTESVLRRLTEAAHSELSSWRTALETRGHLQDEVRAQEAAARAVLNFQPNLIPGLLQTADYARRIFETFQVPYAADELAAAVAARLHRQPALYDPGRRFEFLLGEGALRLRPGPAHVLLAQLDRIASVSTLDTVSVGVIAADARATTTIPHSFVLYDGDEPHVAVEMIDANRLIRASEEVEMYRERWTLLRRMAVFGDDARAFLAAVAADIRRSADT